MNKQSRTAEKGRSTGSKAGRRANQSTVNFSVLQNIYKGSGLDGFLENPN
jgi:hypothetical protein